ncbi:RluA family pseudouridine synthase [Pacificimonas aurantium]|nr:MULTISPECIES: RluA family pseudouridine synthase [Pacificimonas]MBZ6378339.1 RluA family pseudouridine synthase [Pacificimonas aurantium]
MAERETSIQIEIPEGFAGDRLDRALAALAPHLSRERLKSLLKAGAVSSSTGPERQPSRKVRAGERFVLAVPQPVPDKAQPQDIPLAIAFEDDHLIVVDKPAGLVVHPAAGNPDGTLVNALLHHCGGSLSGIGGVTRPGIVHRIDKDTSGLLVAAKTAHAHMGLAAQFAAHSVGRRYFAAVRGRPSPPSGRVEGNIGRSPKNRKKMAVLEDGRGKPAVTHYETVDIFEEAALVRCRLETGRTHQVRVHMAAKGNPLLGDPLYGGRGGKGVTRLLSQLGFRRQALHAASLQFLHPETQENLSFESPLPGDMQELVAALSRS